MVVLHELRGDTVLGEGFRTVAFRKKSAVIAEAGGGDHDHAGERGLFEGKGQNINLIIRIML